MLNFKWLAKRVILHPFQTLPKVSRILSHMRKYNRFNTRPEFRATFKNACMFPYDLGENAGSLGYYFWQDLWCSRKIYQRKPPEHYDIGSRVDGFIAHVLSFMPVTLIDIRPLPYKIEGLNFIQADATNLEGIADRSIISLSSLCAPEHFGLGRYGDPVDPEACFMALRSMQRVLAPGGHLYIAVPVGDVSGVAFNAHRIFAPEIVAETLNELRLEDFSVINGTNYTEHISFDEFHSMGLGIDYGANVEGLFEFVRD